MKRLQTLVLLLSACLYMLAAGKGNIFLEADFEGGVIPEGWTQESARGAAGWTIEDATSAYPSGSYEGSYHLALRNNTNQTQRYVQRLISPVMDLTNVINPIVVFAHVQSAYAGDVDTLRVYYRTSAQSRWILLGDGEFGKRLDRWQTDTLLLDAKSATYQVMFEGTDNGGRGIALDDIQIRPYPTCETPYGFSANTAPHAATFRYAGSLDADSFLVAVTAREAENYEDLTAADFIYHKWLTDDYSVSLSDLEQNTTYYVYIRSYCQTEMSATAKFFFKTDNLQSLPYTENFNREYQASAISHVNTWTYGTSIMRSGVEMDYMPFINTGTSSYFRPSYSPDSTSALIFSGARDCDTPIPAGEYVYTATPELDCPGVSTLQARFIGSGYYNAHYKGFTPRLIVGVMTNPADITTFTPVDTVTVQHNFGYEEFVVNFAGYQGQGKHIAFLSNFSDQKNIFYLDNLTIETAPAISRPTELRISMTGRNTIALDGKLHGATGYNIILAKGTGDGFYDKVRYSTAVFYDRAADLPEDSIIARISGTSLPARITLPEGYDMRYVQVYLQGTKGSAVSEWSRPEKIFMPKVLNESDYPFLITFETSEPRYTPSELHNYTRGDISYTYLPYTLRASLTGRLSWPQTAYQTTPAAKDGNQALQLRGRELDSDDVPYTQYGDYVALPYVDTLSVTSLKFYLAETADHSEGTSRVEVGTMSDPFDASTFVGIATFNGAYDDNVPCVVHFNGYTGSNHYIAIRGVKAAKRLGDYESSSFIDHITIEKNRGCTEAADIKATPSDSDCVIAWNGSNAQTWRVRVGRSISDILVDATTDQTSYKVTGLTPNTAYVYTVTPACATDESKTDIYNFRTDCSHEGYSLPFYADFEQFTENGFNDMSSYPKVGAELPCWTYPQVYYSGYYFPGVYHASWLGYNPDDTDGSCFGLGMNMSHAEPMYVALPRMSEPVKKLELRFLAKASSKPDTLYVGVMTDPNDRSTFYKIEEIHVESTDYREFIVDFDGYSGNGEYITILSEGTVEYTITCIDNIYVNLIPACGKIQDLKADDTTINGARLTWTNKDATKWNIRIANVSSLRPDTLHADQIVCTISADTNPFIFTNDLLEQNTTYYAYAAPVCDGAEWSNPAGFKTACMTRSVDEIGTIDFSDVNELSCWTVGLRQGTTATPNRNSGYLNMQVNAASDGAYAIMPPIDISDIRLLQVSFDAWAYNNASYARSVNVGVITSPEDISTFNSAANISNIPLTQANAQRYTVRFDGYKGDYNGEYGRYIAFMLESGDKADYVYIDNIRIDTIPACASPAEVTASVIDVDSIVLNWAKTGSNYNLVVEGPNEYKVDVNLTDTFYVIRGLGQVQTYTAKVRSICSSEPGLWSNERAFTTICPPQIKTPVSYDFENVTSGDMPACWGRYYYGNKDAEASYPRVTSSLYGSSKSLDFYIYNATRECIAVTPSFDTFDGTTLAFDYFIGGTSKTGGLVIAIASNIDSLEAIQETAYVLDTITSSTTAVAHYARDLSPFKDKGSYIVLMGLYRGSSTTYFEVDDFSIVKNSECTKPLGLTADAKAKSATISWQPTSGKAGSGHQWLVKTATETYTVDTTTYVMTDLEPNTSYNVSVAAICSAADTTEWVSMSFSTPCEAAAPGSVWNFRSGDPTYAYVSTYRVPACWDGGKGNGSGASYRANITNNTTSYTYSIEPTNTSDGAIRFYQNASNYNSYVVLPELGVSPDSAVLQFFGRPARYNVSTKKYSNITTNKTLYVGVISDPADFTTFTPIDTVTNRQTLTTSSAVDELFGFEEFNIPLARYTGGRVAIVYPKGSSTQYYCIDSVSILPADACAMGLVKADVRANEVDLTWTPTVGDSVYVVEVSTDKNFNDLVYTEKHVREFVAHIDNLTANTTYYYRTKHLCSEDNESAYQEGTFTTPATPRFAEDFSKAVNTPANWTRYDVHYQNIFTGMHKLNDEPKVGTMVGGEYYHAWNRSDRFGGSMTSNLSDAYITHMWLMMPNIDLSKMDGQDSLMLSFDIAMTSPEGLEPNTRNNPDDIFLVAVSPDNGTTWDEQNSFIWKTNDNVRNLNTFSATMQNVRIDLSAYVGKQVKIAFYAGGSSENTSNNWLYLDNVQLNRYSINEYNAQSCQYADYEDELFNIRAEAVVPGTYQYEKFVTAQTDGQNDVINRMTLNVTAAETVDYYAQTCAGSHYEGHNFVIDDAQTAVYKRKFTSVNGCDSIVNLYLTANIVSHETVIDTICQGGSYVWNGKTFQTATVLTDTLTSAAGCDSIVTLVLSVREAIRTTEDKFLCYGNTLQLGNLLITEGGQYTATLPSADNCDSIVTWNVIAVPELHSIKRAMICTGSAYDDGQFVGLTREVTVSATDISLVSGCDSIVTLKLFVANAGETRHDTIAPADLPYVLNGTELLPAGTANGTYEKTVSLPCGNVTLFITVGSSTGLHGAWGSNVRIAPNPVSVNEPIRITGLTAGRQTISIYDAVGRLALRTQNDAADCTINGPDEAGIYMIQITDAQGMTYHAKLVVK